MSKDKCSNWSVEYRSHDVQLQLPQRNNHKHVLSTSIELQKPKTLNVIVYKPFIKTRALLCSPQHVVINKINGTAQTKTSNQTNDILSQIELKYN